jgi:hypothetical protein
MMQWRSPGAGGDEVSKKSVLQRNGFPSIAPAISLQASLRLHVTVGVSVVRAEICKHCGAALPSPRRLKFFCSYAHRAAHGMAARIPGPSGLVGSKNTKRNKALQAFKRLSRDGHAFVAVNAVTHRIDGRSKHGVGWLMQQQAGWVARVGNRASDPLPFEAAKHAALTMLRDRNKGIAVVDPIHALNLAAAAEVDCVSAVMRINDDDQTFRVTVKWGGEQQQFDRSINPEDDATDVLSGWGFRGLFALSWANGSVATFIDTESRKPSRAATPGAFQNARVHPAKSNHGVRNY